jgi:hypothetical protein
MVVGAALLLSCVGVTNAAAAQAATTPKPAHAEGKKHAEHAAKAALMEAKGTVVSVDKAGKSVVVKTSEGAEETFVVGKGATVKGLKAGTQLSVSYAEEGGKKVAHALKHM